MQKKLILNITGRVQGVAFRKSAQKEADKLDLKGYAKNLFDGSVEIIVEGKESNLKEFLKWCFEGSLLARVDSLNAKWSEFSNEFSEFKIIREKNNIISDQIHAFKNLGKSIINLPKETNIPQHVAIICDGNRRWAKKRNLPISEGHKAGAQRLIKLIEEARDLEIKYLTLWAFSSENWKREESEVSSIMNLFMLVKKFEKDFHKNQIHFKQIGRKDRLPEKLSKEFVRIEKATEKYNKYFLNVAIDYGGNDEILRAIQKGVEQGIDMTKISQEEFGNLLDTAGMPNPDLIIRTSGELRLSGLFSWQSSYLELYFTSVNLPDFDLNELKKAILDYSNRNRRFGGNK